jgi:hypothetical protein
VLDLSERFGVAVKLQDFGDAALVRSPSWFEFFGGRYVFCVRRNEPEFFVLRWRVGGGFGDFVVGEVEGRKRRGRGWVAL